MPFWLKFAPRNLKLSVPTTNTLTLKTYRLGLLTLGAFWILIASTLCGCGAANGWVKNQQGRLYYRQGNYVAARSEFERALMDNPYRASYAYNVAKTMEKQGDTSGAEELYSHALALNPAHRPTYSAYSTMLTQQGRADDARQLLTGWSTTQPYSARAKMETAKVERQTGNLQAAEQQYAAALDQRPLNPAIRREVRSFLRNDMGRPDLAMNLMNYKSLSQNSYYQASQNSGGMQSPAQHMAGYMPQVDSTVPTGITPVNHSYQSTGEFYGGGEFMPSSQPYPVEMAPMVMPQSGQPTQQNFGPSMTMPPGMDLQLPGEPQPTPAAPATGVQQGVYHQPHQVGPASGLPVPQSQYQQAPPLLPGQVPSPYETSPPVPVTMQGGMSGAAMPVQNVGWSTGPQPMPLGGMQQALPMPTPSASQPLSVTHSF